MPPSHLDLTEPRPRRRPSRSSPLFPYCLACIFLTFLAISALIILGVAHVALNSIIFFGEGDGLARERTDLPTVVAQAWNGTDADPDIAPSVAEFALVLLSQLHSLFGTTIALLNIHYWMTRSVCTGISLRPVVISIFITTLSDFLNVTGGIGQSLVAYLSLLCILGEPPVFNLYLLLEWSWGGLGGWLPTEARRRKATHRENASERIEKRFGRWERSGVFILLFMAHAASFLSLADTASLPAFFQLDTAVEISNVLTDSSRSYLMLSQSLHNRQSRNFAGAHPLSAWLAVLESLSRYTVPPLLASLLTLRTQDIDFPHQPSRLLTISLQLYLLSQAILYPTVSQAEEVDE